MVYIISSELDTIVIHLELNIKTLYLRHSEPDSCYFVLIVIICKQNGIISSFHMHLLMDHN